MRELTQQYLKEAIDYNFETGIFIWKERHHSHFKNKKIAKSWNSRFAGTVAGSVDRDGYIKIKVNYCRYFAHRLAYLYVYGYMPENQIDHKDRVRHHNWIENLREATQQCQNRNKNIGKNNKSGVVGVRLAKGKWRATIGVDKKYISLGSFKFFKNAVFARWEAEKKYKFPNCCTSSSAYSYLKEKGMI